MVNNERIDEIESNRKKQKTNKKNLWQVQVEIK